MDPNKKLEFRKKKFTFIGDLIIEEFEELSSDDDYEASGFTESPSSSGTSVPQDLNASNNGRNGLENGTSPSASDQSLDASASQENLDPPTDASSPLQTLIFHPVDPLLSTSQMEMILALRLKMKPN